MTTSSDLRAAAVTALTGATAAGGNVFSPRTWPTWNGSYPVLFQPRRMNPVNHMGALVRRTLP